MRIIALMPDEDQVGFLVDSLRNAGFDRKDIIISDLAKAAEERLRNPEEAADEIAFIKTERDELWETAPFADGIEGLNAARGILVAVECPKKSASRVREIMEQSGAAKIMQD
ncbi:MAG: hypothetical protein K6T65_08280 [Peptococcaceae bacterium]|nr:hypothetical protein [Peptococcaceae bacterium]